jgi:hypothetical protein
VRLAVTLAFVIAVSPAQAASLTLGCTGTLTTSNVPKDGVAPEPEKENVSGWSIVVDLDQRECANIGRAIDDSDGLRASFQARTRNAKIINPAP